jgi:hypothetical protein
MTQGIVTVLLDALAVVPPAEVRENHVWLVANGNALPQRPVCPFRVLRSGHYRILIEQAHRPENIERGTHIAARHRVKLKPRTLLNGGGGGRDYDNHILTVSFDPTCYHRLRMLLKPGYHGAQPTFPNEAIIIRDGDKTAMCLFKSPVNSC